MTQKKQLMKSITRGNDFSAETSKKRQHITRRDRKSSSDFSLFTRRGVNHMLSVTLWLQTGNFCSLPTYSVLTHACPMLNTEGKRGQENTGKKRPKSLTKSSRHLRIP
jgi:hypothetical protein